MRECEKNKRRILKYEETNFRYIFAMMRWKFKNPTHTKQNFRWFYQLKFPLKFLLHPPTNAWADYHITCLFPISRTFSTHKIASNSHKSCFWLHSSYSIYEMPHRSLECLKDIQSFLLQTIPFKIQDSSLLRCFSPTHLLQRVSSSYLLRCEGWKIVETFLPSVQVARVNRFLSSKRNKKTFVFLVW